MSHGLVEQIGTPREVYDEPTTEFVADFLGISNLLSAEAVSGDSGECLLRVGEFTLTARAGETAARGHVRCVVRPERVNLEPADATAPNRVPGTVERLVYLGSATRAIARMATGQTLQSLIPSDGQPVKFEQGSAVQIELPADALRVLKGGGRAEMPHTEHVPGDQLEGAADA
jgi:ABC-type Fe3+/spermidine/putrescine transport system ATPase subunit